MVGQDFLPFGLGEETPGGSKESSLELSGKSGDLGDLSLGIQGTAVWDHHTTGVEGRILRPAR